MVLSGASSPSAKSLCLPGLSRCERAPSAHTRQREKGLYVHAAVGAPCAGQPAIPPRSRCKLHNFMAPS